MDNKSIKKLESDLWESADLLRAGSKLTSNQYCMPVLGLIFLRYAYSRFKKVEAEILKNRPMRNGRVIPVEAIDFAEKSALFLPREAQYDYLVNLPEDISAANLADKNGDPIMSLGVAVNNAMALVEDQSEQLKGVLPKEYTIFSDELLSELLRIFNNNALDDVGGDVIGRIYEYFLNKFAKNVAQDDGVFFTPKSLVKMIVNILEPTSGILLERTFGGYISVYDFKRAVEDGATVPLYYENRGERLKVNQDDMLTDKILDAVEKADLDPDQEEKLEHEFEKEIHVLTAEPRLRRIAKDFVGHYSDLWTSGKAMFVCLNKVTCVRMYNYVQEYWKEEIQDLEKKAKTLSQQENAELQKKINWMKQTEMCVVISQEQNEIKTFEKWGLDIKPHRMKMEKRELDKEFKDADNPFRVVFVCAMWLTGFDVKCLSCLYLDKPMKAHTLMQTIARANRVTEGKENGLIIDYIGIVGALRKALAAYTANPAGRGGSDPTIDKEKLVAKIEEAVAKGKELLKVNGSNLDDLIAAKNFDKMALLLHAANAMCGDQKVKKTFSTYAGEVKRLLKYLDRDDITEDIRKEAETLIAILNQINKKRVHADNTDLMVEIDGIISEYISVDDIAGPNELVPNKKFDISKIDFGLLAREFDKARNQNLLLRDLDETVYDRIQKMMAVNPKRIDYLKRYQEIIDNYNQEQDKAAIEKTFMDLMNLAGSMSTEQRRYVREGFENDEQLSIYDLLFRDDLSKEDIRAIKKVSVDLLAKIKRKISELDHWTDKQETRAAVDILIRDTLWEELPESYDDKRIKEYRNKIYEYVYTHYPEVNAVA